jgi:uncharacterized protein YmfQ (DUF2313 family)
VTLTVDDAQFTQMLSGLSPTGDLWSTEPDTVRMQWLAAFALSWQRLNDRANALVVDAFPSTTVELLPEWEASLGLPDPCAGPDATVELRQAHVVARLTQNNGPSLPSLIAFAAALGYPITIQEFTDCRADNAVADDLCNEPAWAWVWQITYEGVTIFYASADEARADDQVETTGNRVLECEMERISPAHTQLFFAYTGVA